jgi:hypothetical protein
VICEIGIGEAPNNDDIEFSPNWGTTDSIWTNGWPGSAKWVFFVVTFDEAKDVAEAFINGVSIGTKANAGKFTEGNALNVATWFVGSGVELDGKMAHFFVAERLFTVAEIGSLYKAASESGNAPRASVVREPPRDLDRLAMVLTRPDGTITRWADDEPDVERIPIDLTLSSSIPGGDADVGCALLRDIAYRDADLRNLNKLKVQGPGNENVWSGYLAKSPATRTQVSPAATGDVGLLRGDPSLRMIAVDRDLSHWTGPSNARRLSLISGNSPHKQDAEVIQDKTSKALRLALSDGWIAPFSPRVEAWYDAGQGLKVGRIRFKWAGDSNTAFILQRYVTAEDSPGAVEGSADIYVAAAGTDDYKPATPQQYAFLAWLFNATPAGAEGASYQVSLTELAVYGTDVAAVENPAGGPPGVLAPAVLQAILNKAGNGIEYDPTFVEENPWVIPHLVWLDAVTPEQAILDVNRFFRNLWAIYEGKLKWGAPETFGRLWHVRRDEGADPQLNGPDSEQEFNGCIVQYDDALTGTRRIVGPPGSGYVGPSGLSTEGLVDTDPYLPLNEWNQRRWARVEAGLTSEAGAIRLGELFLEGVRSRLTSGSIEIGAWQVYDETGARYPAWKPRAGDRLLVDDEPNATERLIVEASYKHSDRNSSLTLDSPADALEAIQERLQVVLVGVVD